MRPTAAEHACFGTSVRCERPANVAALGEIIRAAEADGTTILPAGGGTHPEAADPPAHTPVLVAAEHFDRVVLYEPDDFTIGVGAGMRCEELRAELARHRQELAFDFAPGEGTVGGLVARAPYSLRQSNTGPLHSLVLGVEGVSGGGRPFQAGGMVVKNVAGYQIHKVCVGSSGTLGMLTRINFRLRPLPERRTVTVLACDSADAAIAIANALRRSRLEPAFLVLSFDSSSRLPGATESVRVVWSFEGSATRVTWLDAEAQTIAAAAHSASPRSEARTDGEAAEWLGALRAFEEPSDDRAGGVARLASLPATAPALAADLARAGSLRVLADMTSGVVLARWSGATPTDAVLQSLQSAAARHDAFVKVVHVSAAERRRIAVDLTPDPNATLASRIRAAFDPHGVFARRRPTPSPSPSPSPALAATRGDFP